MNTSQDIYVLSACRTPIGSFGGTLKDTPAVDLGTLVVTESITRAGITPKDIDEVILGCVLSAGLGQNIARQIAVKAGIPVTVPAMTLNMVCGSGMKTVVEAARAIRAGDAEIIVVGGTESMSNAGFLSTTARWGARMGHSELSDTMLTDGLLDSFEGYHMGITAENVADGWDISREDMDEIALRSQTRADEALRANRFHDEIVPVPLTVKREEILFDTDEYPRATSAETLRKLKPAFTPDGRVTAGNSSGINDGAAALILASAHVVERLGLKPMARLIGWGQAGVDPSIMGVGPIEASRKALTAAGLTIDDCDLVEANEAFAAQAAAVTKDLGLDINKLNVNGGAIALGHPIGASGARIIVTLLHEMAKRDDAQRGLATLCIGGGMGIATVFEKI
ncbi:MAG: acetyl-CoA C-acetyltransferase [Propionibacteriaceae bacterium]|jgi:acetyl-CoA C-acetyltransferase|nr:acetyl-CoA C-acetyltransferase [Propionibacteriaceae bacterium]